MRIFDFKHLILLVAALALLGACGKNKEISTDFILEDERSWKEQDVVITQHPDKPDHTIIKDEFGTTIVGPNGEIISQTIGNIDPEIPEPTPTPEPTPEVTEEPVEVVTEEDNDQHYFLLPRQEDEDIEDHESQHGGETMETQPITADWENFAMAYPYAGMSEDPGCHDTPSLRDVMDYGSAIDRLGGKFKDPAQYDNDLIGFSKFLTDVGVKYFTAYEMTKPGNSERAKTCKVDILLPKKGCWLRSAAIALISDKIRGNQKAPIKMTSHYRTPCYNRLTGGSTRSDHLSARAADLAFGNKEMRERAQDFICKTFWQDDLVGLKGLHSPHTDSLNVSIGLGHSFMHIGFGSEHGRRYWIYKSYKEGGNKNKGCWTWKL